MFSRHKSSSPNLPSPLVNATDVPSIIAPDLKIIGNLLSRGSIEVAGCIEGNISCTDITVRKGGMVKGDIIANTILIDGEINGLVKGKSIKLSDTARVNGIIIYESLSINDGASIDGQCKSVEKMHLDESGVPPHGEENNIIDNEDEQQNNSTSYIAKNQKKRINEDALVS